jgi:anti-sigma-K factor RskA
LESKDIISSGLLELHVLGLASDEENIQVQQWRIQFPEVEEEIAEIESAMESYAIGHSIVPGDSVKQNILDRISPSENKNIATGFTLPRAKTGKVYSIPAYYKWAIAASIILLIGSLIINYTYYNKYRAVSADLQVAQDELNKQKQMAAEMSKDMDVVTDKNAMPVVLKGTPHAPNALAKVFWMQNTGDVYVDPSNLPAPSAGKQYQLWAIVDGKPVDAGMISTQKGVYRIQKMKSFGKAEAFAITLEKEGGSPTPTMDEMYVMAKIQL